MRIANLLLLLQAYEQQQERGCEEKLDFDVTERTSWVRLGCRSAMLISTQSGTLARRWSTCHRLGTAFVPDLHRGAPSISQCSHHRNFEAQILRVPISGAHVRECLYGFKVVLVSTQIA